MELINPIVRTYQREGAEDPEGFWAGAAEKLPWFRKWDTVYEPDPPSFRWFSGGRTNLAFNCLDHHCRFQASQTFKRLEIRAPGFHAGDARQCQAQRPPELAIWPGPPRIGGTEQRDDDGIRDLYWTMRPMAGRPMRQ